MPRSLRAALFSLGLLAAALPGMPEARAIKRKPAVEAKDHPEVVLITAQNKKTRKEASCTGALIAPRVVLTAAHCVDSFDSWEVLAPHAKDRPVRTAASSARIHPRHRARHCEHDLALLFLPREIDVGHKLPTLYQGELLRLGTKVVLIGRVANGTISPDKLFRSPQVTLVPDRENINIYGGNPPVVEKGDSGGPVYTADREGEIVGIVSGFLEFSSAPVATDVFVPLNRQKRDWIMEEIRKAERERTPGK